MDNDHDDQQEGNDRLILLFLGTAAVVCIIGVVILAVFKTDSQPLVAMASAAIGALATRITSASPIRRAHDEDDFAILGRAATKSIIAEAMRQMGAGASAGGTGGTAP